MYKSRFRQKQKRSRSPAGPRRLRDSDARIQDDGDGIAELRGRDAYGTATRISTSLSRRLSAFFGSTPDQDPKAAKYAILTPGHAGFPKRVKQSECSDSTPVRNAPCFAVCALVSNPLSRAECVPAFTHESKRGPFVPEVLNSV